MARLVVLASGSGTNLQAILDACKAGQLSAQVGAVISDRKGAYALERARRADIPAIYFPWTVYREKGRTRQDYDAGLARVVKEYQPDLIVLAGWMRLLSMAFLAEFPLGVVNLHPALPGTFPGTHAIQRAYQAFRQDEIEYTGVMVHYVPDEGVDDGPLIAEEVVPIFPEDKLETLESRIHQVEHRLLVKAIQQEITRLSGEGSPGQAGLQDVC